MNEWQRPNAIVLLPTARPKRPTRIQFARHAVASILGLVAIVFAIPSFVIVWVAKKVMGQENPR